MIDSLKGKEAAKRFAACMLGSVVLAMMVGTQQGSSTDYSSEFRQSVLNTRIVAFLVIGVAVFVIITYREQLRPFVAKPGFAGVLGGALAVLAGVGLMHWLDVVSDPKFGSVGDAVADTPSLRGTLTDAFFSWLAWTLLLATLVLGLACVAIRNRVLCSGVATLCVFAAVVSVTSHQAAVDAASSSGPDHSLGFGAALLGFLTIGAAALVAGFSGAERADPAAFFRRVMSYRPGLPLVALGLVVSLLGLFVGTWFSPTDRNTSLTETHALFRGQGLNPLYDANLGWLVYVLVAVATAVAAVAAWLGQRVVGILAAAIGLFGSIVTLLTIYDMSRIGGNQGFDGSTGPWQNLGTGGWLTTGGLFLLASAGVVAAFANPAGPVAARETGGPRAPLTSAPGVGKSFGLIAIAAALFYPPTATAGWQTIIVTQIGVAMFLAVGLNVVVGWAGLLDLGFIAFYAIGSYTTAFLVGALPKTPPSWLTISPLWAIPFAIVVCLVAGVLLGAPTLRLRGDYLAIVTLGFGEIIHLIAVNADTFTNGSEGPPKPVPHPVVHVGGLHIQWGLNRLQYWYLLLVLMAIVVLLFRRLEHSRVGRAWAAVREDEVAAQATGINTTRIKLMAFAIGASTSGIAGVFNASMVGTFAPDNFLLNNSILIVAYVVFGGMGSIVGAMAGAALLTWLPQFLQDVAPPADQYMWIGAVVILMMIFRPAGLVPARRRRAELSGELDNEPRSETRAVPVAEGL